jgi:hypothetical protein
MSTTGMGCTMMEAKFVGSTETDVDVVVMPLGRRVQIPVAEERLGEWKRAQPGQAIQIKVTTQYAMLHDLLGPAFGGGPTHHGGVITG